MRLDPSRAQQAALKTGLFVLCLVPFVQLVWRAAANALGANPVEAVQRSLGWWTLFLLLATLAVTPVRRWTGADWLLRLRRMLGLFAFFYACAHFITYAWLDVWFDPAAIAKDVIKRPFITVGFLALVLMVPLAFTSTQAMQRRLGRGWRTLHRLVYAVAILGVLHFWWLVKRDVSRPLMFALVLGLLLGARAARSRGATKAPQGRESDR